MDKALGTTKEHAFVFGYAQPLQDSYSVDIVKLSALLQFILENYVLLSSDGAGHLSCFFICESSVLGA